MSKRILQICIAMLLVLSMTVIQTAAYEPMQANISLSPVDFGASELTNTVKNGNFETGMFSPWVNRGGTGYNRIQSSIVYDGSYSLYLESHLSSVPYEPVYQELDLDVPFSETHRIESAIYPTKVGNNCGQAGVSELHVTIMNINTRNNGTIFYEWSGYTYPGGDLGSNVTHVRYLLFDWTPNVWNLLNRSLYDDYVAFFGVPSDVSEYRVVHLSFLCHSSNGDPGDFYVDNVALGSVQEVETPTQTDTSTTSISTTSTTTNSTTTSTESTFMSVGITIGSLLVIMVIGAVVCRSRRKTDPYAAARNEEYWYGN